MARGRRQLGDSADVAGDDLVDGEMVLAAQVEQPVQTLLGGRRRVDEAVVAVQRARQDLEQRDLTDELVGDRLEHVGHRGARGVGRHGDRFGSAGDRGRAVGGRRAELADVVGEAVDPHSGGWPSRGAPGTRRTAASHQRACVRARRRWEPHPTDSARAGRRRRRRSPRRPRRAVDAPRRPRPMGSARCGGFRPGRTRVLRR